MSSPVSKKKRMRFLSSRRLSKSKKCIQRRRKKEMLKKNNVSTVEEKYHMQIENVIQDNKLISACSIAKEHNYALISDDVYNNDFIGHSRNERHHSDTTISDELSFSINIYSGKEEMLKSGDVKSDKSDLNNEECVAMEVEEIAIEKTVHRGDKKLVSPVFINELSNDKNLSMVNDFQNSSENEFEIREKTERDVNNIKNNELLEEIFNDMQNHETPETETENKKDGREILQLDYFSDKFIKLIYSHMEVYECNGPLKCVQKVRSGLISRFGYSCSQCNFKEWISSEDTNRTQMNLNEAAVLGTINIGIGFTQLSELFAAMDINCMNAKTYKRKMDAMYDLLRKCSLDSMIAAGEEEKKLAVANNQLHESNPWITVVVDGCWMTRSYGNNYDSLSGAAVIIGQRTGKVLYAGVRNKYCSKCEYLKRNNMAPTDHPCFKNWDRNAPSTGMESDIILEGFRSSVEMHGLIYKVFVSDGDSSVYKNITDNDVYNEYLLVPTRIRCYNHLLRNLCTKLNIASKTTQRKGTIKIKDFVALRNFIKNKILPIRKLIDFCVDQRRTENLEFKHQKLELQHDILVIPLHICGDHSKCNGRAFYDEECKNYEKENILTSLKKAGLYEKIEEAVETLSKFTESLLYKVTNNMAESFNSLICVDIGGKRINYGLTCQYNTRVFAAVIKHNSQQLLTEVNNYKYGFVPETIKVLDRERQIKVSRNRESRRLQGRKRKFSSKKNKDKYYGDKSQQKDLPEEDMKNLEKIHFDKLKENQSDRVAIEERTRDQSDSMEWVCLRKKLLTASHFASIICSKETTGCAQKVKNILYPSNFRTPGMQYGIDHEDEAVACLEKMLNTKVLKCGLYIDPVYPYLACTPDGKIGNDGIIEVKTSLAAENLTAEEAVKTVKHLKSLLKENNGTYKLNEKHNYYYQVQGQLHITQKSYCIFVFWTPKSMIHIRVERDDLFWKEKMESLLHRFYMKCMLPEILDSRWNRSMPLREPDYILEAKEKKAKQIAEQKKNDSIKKELKKIIVTNKKRKMANRIEIKKTSGDIELIGLNSDYEWTIDDTISHLTFIESREIPMTAVIKNVLNDNGQLNDDSLDAFIRVASENHAAYNMQSVLFISYPQLIEPVLSNKGISIIGGNCTGHWRVAYYDDYVIKIYDTLVSHNQGRLHEAEELYLNLRFPKAQRVIVQKMSMQQPDGLSCGIYAAAIVCDILSGINPSNAKYSLNVTKIRKHFVDIIKAGTWSTFPKDK